MILQLEVLGVSLEFHGLFSSTFFFLYFYLAHAIIFASVMCLMQLFILVIIFADGVVEEMINTLQGWGKIYSPFMRQRPFLSLTRNL